MNKTVEDGRRIDDDKLEDIKDDLKTFKEDLKTLREGPDGEKFCLFAVLDAGSAQSRLKTGLTIVVKVPKAFLPSMLKLSMRFVIRRSCAKNSFMRGMTSRAS